MKKAFTMMELVFVIIVIGILLAIIIPRIHTDKLNEAGVQVLGHIRYTQHLAMIDDKYDSTDINWYNRRWRISFNNGADTNNMWAYTIWSDSLANASGSPDPAEIALNPLDPSKRLTGGFNGVGFIHTGDAVATAEMNLGEKYGILDVDFSAPCRTAAGSRSLGFDHLGRPLRGAIENYTSAYDSAILINILVPTQCVISLCSVANCAAANADEKVDIAIEAETGYAHIL
jgi:prepilin-type N-terminal cleavage/methylation domain-containing protein